MTVVAIADDVRGEYRVGCDRPSRLVAKIAAGDPIDHLVLPERCLRRARLRRASRTLDAAGIAVHLADRAEHGDGTHS